MRLAPFYANLIDIYEYIIEPRMIILVEYFL